MPDLRTVLVAGGTGFIGSHLCKLLQKNGYGIQVISRMPGPFNISWNELNSKGLPDKIHAVINVSGQNVLDMKQRWTPGFKQNVYNSRINTNKALVNAINNAHCKPEVFITISGVGIYEPDTKKEYDENSPVKPYDFLSKMCVDWEKSGEVDEKTCIRRVNIRSGVVLNRDGGMIQQLYMPFFCGVGGPVMPGTQFLPWIHMHDLCRMFLHSLQKNISGNLNGVAPQIITNNEFSKVFASAMRRPCLFPVPEFVLNFLLGKDRANMLTKGQKVHPSRVLESGFKYEYSTIQEACKEILR